MGYRIVTAYTMPVAFAERVKQAADAKGITASDLICALIERHVKEPAASP